MENELHSYEKKVKSLSLRTKDECEDIKSTLEKKRNLRKIRTAEIDILQQVWYLYSISNWNMIIYFV